MMNNIGESNYLLESVLSMIEMENLILEAYLSEDELFDVALEADMVTRNQKRSRINMINIIQKYFDKVIEMFQNFVTKYGMKHSRFLKKVESQYGNVNYYKTFISVDTNYMAAEAELRKMRTNPFFRTLTNPNFLNDTNLANLLSKDKDGVLSMDDFLNSSICSKYVSRSGSLAEGIKNVFRYGNVDHEQKLVKVSGGDLEQICHQCVDYCKGYKSLVRDLKSMKSVASRAMSIMEDKLETMQESVLPSDYSLLEETSFANTDLNYCSWVMELTGPTHEDPAKARQQQQQREEAKANNPRVETQTQQDPNKTENQMRRERTQQDKQNVQQTAQTAEEERNKGRMQLLKFCAQALQIYVSSALTVAEERYLNYIKVLSHVFKGANMFADEGKDGKDMVSRTKKEEYDAQKTKKKTKKGLLWK